MSQIALLSLGALLAAGLAEAIKQQHVAAVPLSVFLIGVIGTLYYLRRGQPSVTKSMPGLVKLKEEGKKDPFAKVAVPNSVIYVLPKE